MPLLPRDTVVDRPTLVDRDDDEDETAQDNEETEEVIEQLGQGGGPVINRVEFEQGDYAVVAASNLVAALSTAQTEGAQYEQAFITTAMQVKEMSKRGIDITGLSRLSRDRGIDDVNVSGEELNELKLATRDINEVDEVEEIGEDDEEVGEDDEENEEVIDEDNSDDEEENEELTDEKEQTEEDE